MLGEQTGGAVFRADVLRRLREIRAAVDALERALGGPGISAGDLEVCELLLPAWRSSSLAGRAVTVAELFEAGAADAGELGAWLTRWRERFDSDRRARKALGELLGRVQGAEVAGLAARRLGKQGGSAVWDCSPPSVP